MTVSTCMCCVFLVVFLWMGTSARQHARSSQLRSLRRQHSDTHVRCGSDFNDNTEQQFEKKIREADFVFTGKVTEISGGGEERHSVQVDSDGNDFDKTEGRILEVRIKRALKGKFAGSLADVVLTKPHTHQVVQVVLGEHEGEQKNRCYHVIRVHHTAIFLAIKQEQGNTTSAGFIVRLISHPLSLTLRNLDRVSASVKDMTYKPRPPIIEEACEKTYCAFGANCVMDAEGRARCQCPTECPSVFTPVCGTDGITYSNHCLLRKKSCHNEDNTRVQHSGECGAQGTSTRRRLKALLPF